MSRLLYNPTHRIIDSWRHGDLIVTFLDNACRELSDEVAAAALKEFSWLRDITPSNTEDVKTAITEVKKTINELQNEKTALEEEASSGEVKLVVCEKCGEQFKDGHGIKLHKNKCYAKENEL